MCLMKTATVSPTAKVIMCSTPFLLPIGVLPRPWSSGVSNGRRCVTPSLKKRVWMFASTTAAMNDRASSSYPPFTKDPLSELWKRKASRPKRVSSIGGSEPLTPLFAICERNCLSYLKASKRSRQSWTSRKPHPSLFRCNDILICVMPKPIRRKPRSAI